MLGGGLMRILSGRSEITILGISETLDESRVVVLVVGGWLEVVEDVVTVTGVYKYPSCYILYILNQIK